MNRTRIVFVFRSMQKSSHYRQKLKKLMAKADIASLEELSKITGVPQLQLIRLTKGLMAKMQVETILKLSRALNITLEDFIDLFSAKSAANQNNEIKSLKQEYQRLEKQLEFQKEDLEKQFQKNSIQTLESWLLQWPAAATAAKNNPQLSAAKLLPLVKPIEKLLALWGVEPIGSVGAELAYDPQYHQLMEGKANPGDLVKIRYLGYLYRGDLLYRAKVSLVKKF